MEKLRDLITGKPISEYEDEPIHQDTEALLLKLGYSKDQILVDAVREVELDGSPETIKADLLVVLNDVPALVLRCARGSIVTREKEAVATARVVRDPWAPLAAVTNRDDAHLLDTATGRTLASGLGAIPGPEELAALLREHKPVSPSPRQAAQAIRVYLAMNTLQCECPQRCEIQKSLAED